MADLLVKASTAMALLAAAVAQQAAVAEESMAAGSMVVACQADVAAAVAPSQVDTAAQPVATVARTDTSSEAVCSPCT